MRNKIVLSLASALLVLALIAAAPFAYYWTKLPPNNEIKQGAGLTDLFAGFDKSFVAAINSEDISEKMVCLSCLPKSGKAASCNNMSSFITKNLAKDAYSMLAWHIENAYLAKAIQMKYDNAAIQSLYFSMLANIFNEKDIGALCRREFSKSCNQLDASELRNLQRSFSSGKFPPPSGPSDDAFASCF